MQRAGKLMSVCSMCVCVPLWLFVVSFSPARLFVVVAWMFYINMMVMMCCVRYCPFVQLYVHESVVRDKIKNHRQWIEISTEERRAT